MISTVITPLVVSLALSGSLSAAVPSPLDPPAEPSPKQDAPKQDAPKEAKDGKDTTPPDDGLPDLDDILGLDGPERPREEGPVELPDPTQTELDRKLSGEEVAERFAQAVTLMGESADRIERGSDTGIVTQRMQEDILRKLDAVLEAAQQQQSSSSQSEPSTSNSPQEQPSQQQQQSGSQSRGTDNSQERMGPGLQEGPMNPAVEAAQAAWGALPERVRDALVQGSSDQFSSLYRTMTEAYYRRLAEEAEQ